jgi:hypothetical protein
MHFQSRSTDENNCLLFTFHCLDQLISLEVGLASLNSSLLAMSAQVPLAAFPLILPFFLHQKLPAFKKNFVNELQKSSQLTRKNLDQQSDVVVVFWA